MIVGVVESESLFSGQGGLPSFPSHTVVILPLSLSRTNRRIVQSFIESSRSFFNPGDQFDSFHH